MLRFHSAGREDLDVRMLGVGRPFVFELEEARRVPTGREQLEMIEKSINSTSKLVQVIDLQPTDVYALDLRKPHRYPF